LKYHLGKTRPFITLNSTIIFFSFLYFVYSRNITRRMINCRCWTSCSIAIWINRCISNNCRLKQNEYVIYIYFTCDIQKKISITFDLEYTSQTERNLAIKVAIKFDDIKLSCLERPIMSFNSDSTCKNVH
jgi:hypothetical protein